VKAIEAKGLSKSFGGVRVLDGVSLDVAEGEIHGLIGRNGSGKSTLIKILSGYHHPDPGGALTVRGREVELPVAPGQSGKLGLAFVHQDLGLTPSLTVLENLRVGRFESGRAWRINWRKERAIVRKELERFDLRVSPEIKVEKLTSIQRVLLAIVRAFADLEEADGGVLILDEPTAYLPRDGVVQLFEAVRRAAQEGSGVIFVSHRLEEISTLTERVSVLRDGKLAGTVVTKDVPESRLIEMIVGRQLEEAELAEHASTNEVVLEAQGLSGEVAHDVGFKLRRGEVLGLTGLIGMGHEEVPYLLFGAAPGSGKVVVDGRALSLDDLSPRRAIDAGMALLPADRQRDSGVGRLSVKENMTLPVVESFYVGARLRPQREYSHVVKLLDVYDVVPRRPNRELGTLSGGNQQKALLAKWLQQQPRIVLLHEPTQGIDVGAREQVSKEIAEIAAQGTSVILCSSEYDDLARMSERVLVFRDGRVVRELHGDALTEERIVEQCYAT
jgi:ribose transport system ATP-binding protein